jgi:hypothetical protein
MSQADNLTTILCRCHEIGNHNFLEPSGLLQACNGTAFTILCDPHFICCSLCHISSPTAVSVRSSVQTQFCCNFSITFFQLLVRAFHTVYPSEICMLFLECVWNAWAKFRTEFPTRNEWKIVHIDTSVAYFYAGNGRRHLEHSHTYLLLSCNCAYLLNVNCSLLPSDLA